jgi:hypothetical protein
MSIRLRAQEGTLSNRRKHERHARRIKVRYGVDELDHRGLITDISVGGVFIKCRRPLDLRTRIHMRIMDPGGEFYAEGIVVRQRLVDSRYRIVEDQGMGVRFLQPAELVREVIPRKRRRFETNTVVCRAAPQVEELLTQQLSAGLLMVPVSDPPPEASTVVEFTVRLLFGERREFEGQGRVVQVFRPDDAPHQALIEVQDAAQLRESLEEQIEQ